jgi:hypothetical protein
LISKQFFKTLYKIWVLSHSNTGTRFSGVLLHSTETIDENKILYISKIYKEEF